MAVVGVISERFSIGTLDVPDYQLMGHSNNRLLSIGAGQPPLATIFASLLLPALAWLGPLRSAPAVDTVVILSDGRPLELVGKVLAEARDGGILLLAVDGQMWAIQPNQIKSRARDDRPFVPLARDELAQQMLSELPGFSVLHTQHYLIVYNTSQAYAQWCGSLFERLHRGFFNYWKTRGWELVPPEFPLVAVVFDSRERFVQYGRPELGDAVQGVIGYYNMRSNRVAMYDLTGADEWKRIRPQIRNSTHINQILAQPEAERTVATIVHEATHQLAYNSGLQVRFAGNPMWISEGLATFFETPDLRNDRGWRTVGSVNRLHLTRFRERWPVREPDALLRLLTDDSRFHNTATAAEAYSEAWALNYFLLNRYPQQYVTYLKKLAQLKPLEEWSATERMKAFTEIFGDLKKLEEEFTRYMARVKP